jgi:hypothetical protein
MSVPPVSAGKVCVVLFIVAFLGSISGAPGFMGCRSIPFPNNSRNANPRLETRRGTHHRHGARAKEDGHWLTLILITAAGGSTRARR